MRRSIIIHPDEIAYLRSCFIAAVIQGIMRTKKQESLM